MTSIDPGRIESVVFDFDGTLCCDRFFVALGQEALDTIARLIFGPGSAQWADPWMKGDLTSRDMASYLSRHLPYSPESILAALRQGCARMTFSPAVLRFAVGQRALGRKTALVTANMDVFSEVVVPAHGLDVIFDVVLNTADYGTLDKGILWRKAFSFFGPGYSFESSLLIEDGQKNVELFRSFGGTAYLYRGDQDFRCWLDTTSLSAVIPDA